MTKWTKKTLSASRIVSSDHVSCLHVIKVFHEDLGNELTGGWILFSDYSSVQFPWTVCMQKRCKLRTQGFVLNMNFDKLREWNLNCIRSIIIGTNFGSYQKVCYLFLQTGQASWRLSLSFQCLLWFAWSNRLTCSTAQFFSIDITTLTLSQTQFWCV